MPMVSTVSVTVFLIFSLNGQNPNISFIIFSATDLQFIDDQNEDGLWEHLSNEEAMEMVHNLPRSDAISSTGDNQTPLSRIEKSTGKSLLLGDYKGPSISKNVGIKRNLDSIFDEEKSPTAEAIITGTSSIADEGNVKKKLLTPKLEI
ncbi:hypothetical protein L1987_23313 [Smallanthus sonchifolius]|uniref:Uncharacterized protein n=1 Tax=Smallanthus sonchifolius TaxID=185202 RepID=A0ACB9IIS3_9ASTR|nr:hypothetical protein L1987_23313 [Smallanthus sonchifolius]